jgi:hypothetical protein
VALNRVHRLLVAGLDSEQREKFESELYAPEEGWDAAEARVYANIVRSIGEEVALGGADR